MKAVVLVLALCAVAFGALFVRERARCFAPLMLRFLSLALSF